MKTNILFIVLILILSSCNKSKESDRITIATLKGPSAMGMIKMIDSLSNTKSSNIDITIYNEPMQVRKLILDGKVDIAVLPQYPNETP